MDQDHILKENKTISEILASGLSNGYIIVLGGVNVDICGKPVNTLVPADSNPGKISISFGGVGRNIAHNLALMNTDVRFMTAVGNDFYGKKLLDSLSSLGIEHSHSIVISDALTSSYLFITDTEGEMVLAVSDMDIYDHVSVSYLMENIDFLSAASLIVADTNIPQESIEWLADNVNVPILIDTVSTAKALKIKNIIGKLHAIKPNKIEAELLSGIKITDTESLKNAANVLLNTGLSEVFISLGSEGVYAANHSEHLKLDCLPSNLKNVNGGGDAFMAGVAFAKLCGLSLKDTARFALAASSVAVESSETISPNMCLDSVLEKL